MIDLTVAVQDAFYEALNVPAVANLAPVYQHVPENTQPPITVIGDIGREPIGGKDGGLYRFSVEIITMIRAPRRATLLELQQAVREQIDDQALPAQTGAELSRPVEESSDDEIMEDGITYMGTQRFSLFAQPAD